MDFHLPSRRAARARTRPPWRRSIAGLALAAGFAAVGFTAAGCGATDEEAALEGGDRDAGRLPAELVAADDTDIDDNTDTDGAGDGSSGQNPSGTIDGFEPVEDVETVPAEALDSDAVDLTDDAPDAVIDEVADEIAASGDAEELLDTVDPVDRADTAPTEPDGRSRNGFGELLELDAEANLACGNIEIAIGRLDDGLRTQAGDHIRAAADRAEDSGIADIRAWSDPLRSAAGGDADRGDPAVLIGFLTVCAEGGYEL